MIRFELDALWVSSLDLSTPVGPGTAHAAVKAALVAGDEDVVPQDGGARIGIRRLRTFDDTVLEGLGAPRYRGRLMVQEGGTSPGDARYRWDLRWDGTPATVEGPWVLVGGRRWLLDAAIAEVTELAASVSRLTRPDVFRAIVRLVRLSELDGRIEPTRRLLTRTILSADTLRLYVDVDEQGNPVPSPRLVDTTGPVPVELALDSRMLREVAERGLARDEVVAVGKEQFVVVRADAARNARLALAAPAAPLEDRRKFIENPTAFLPDPDTAFDEEDYSARVVGVGDAPRRGPGDAPEKRRDWTDDGTGLLLRTEGGREVVVAAEQLPELQRALAAAVENGRDSIEWDGETLPASEAARAAVERAIREAPDRPAPPEGERARPRILLIAENEVQLDWVPQPEARRVATTALPPLLVNLQPHQREAIAQLQHLWTEGGRGALLCDDMGLGKTLQGLVFAAWVAQELAAGQRSQRDERAGPVHIPVAIVARPSLLEGWLVEMGRRLAPSCLPRVVWGQKERPTRDGGRVVLDLDDLLIRARGAGTVLEHARVDLDALRQARPDVLLVSYDMLRRLQFAVGQVRFGVLVADEAQDVKDPSSLRSRALRAMHYDFGLAVTGTPIENTWRDLWTLCDFAVPGTLGTLQEFGRAYPRSGDVRELGTRLAGTLKPVLIRRTRKVALSGLPPCTIVRDAREMPPDQAMSYDAERLRHTGGKTGILGLLQELARVSLHPRIRADLTSASDADAWAAASARTAALWDALRRYREEDAAVLVFVRSLAMQETLQMAIRLAFDLPSVPVLNGEPTQAQRQRIVQQVEAGTGFRVLLVSPDVGGAGWNLQFATRAVLLERPYNPAREAQMIARVHRLGQTVPVEVVTAIATHPRTRSFDEVLDELLTEKRTLSDSVLAPASVADDELAQRFQFLAEPPSPTPTAREAAMASPAQGSSVAGSTRHPLTAALAATDAFRDRASAHPALADRALAYLDLLAGSPSGAMSIDAFAEATREHRSRVQGLVAQLGFLNLDGYPILFADSTTQQVRLDVARLRVAYGLPPA